MTHTESSKHLIECNPGLILQSLVNGEITHNSPRPSEGKLISQHEATETSASPPQIQDATPSKGYT